MAKIDRPKKRLSKQDIIKFFSTKGNTAQIEGKKLVIYSPNGYKTINCDLKKAHDFIKKP